MNYTWATDPLEIATTVLAVYVSSECFLNDKTLKSPQLRRPLQLLAFASASHWLLDATPLWRWGLLAAALAAYCMTQPIERGLMSVLAPAAATCALLATWFLAAAAAPGLQPAAVAACAMLVVLFFDVRRVLPSLLLRHFGTHVLKAVAWLLVRLLPLSLALAAAFLALATLLEWVGVGDVTEHRLMNPLIYYGIVWAPWTSIYFRVKWSVLQEHGGQAVTKPKRQASVELPV